MHHLVELAKKSVETFVREGKIMKLPEPLLSELSDKAGVFVCIKKHVQLRGCIGTFMPSSECVGTETIVNAISAATKDPRFFPVKEDELENLTYTVDVLSCPEKVKDIAELDPRKYGIIVASGQRRGLLLPDIEGVGTVEEQLKITRLKAGILPHEEVEIHKFEVKRYT